MHGANQIRPSGKSSGIIIVHNMHLRKVCRPLSLSFSLSLSLLDSSLWFIKKVSLSLSLSLFPNLSALLIDDELKEDGVFPYGHVHRHILPLSLDGELQRHLPPLVLPRVRIDRQGPLLPLEGRGLQDIEPPTNEVILLLEVTTPSKLWWLSKHVRE